MKTTGCTALTACLVLTTLFIYTLVSASTTNTKTLLIRARVGKLVKLIVEKNTVTFPHRDPDDGALIPALENGIKVIVKARTDRTNTIKLLVVADGDLCSGPDTIPSQNVIWQVSGEGFLGGTVNSTTPQTAGSWTGSGTREGLFRYYFRNNSHYPVGDYQTTVTYTLTTP